MILQLRMARRRARMRRKKLVIPGTGKGSHLKSDLLKAAFARYEKYQAWLKRQPLSDQTRRAYRSRINHFLGFLGTSGEDIRKLIECEREAAYVLREYKQYLKRDLKARPATVNAYLTAISHFLQFAGAPPAKFTREDLPQEAPRALSKDEQKRFLRAIMACRRSKDRAVALLLFYSGIRISECAALDLDDVYVIGRKNRITVRSGKGDRYREVPLNTEVKEALQDWLVERNKKFQDRSTGEAFFLNPQGKRLSTASLDLIIRKIGQSCNVELSAHVLRHTCLTNLVRNGNDLVVVAEIAGHKRLETTKRYTLPTVGDKQRALEGLIE